MAGNTSPPNGQHQNESRDMVLLTLNTPAPTPFRFLDLPAEIRNMIYIEAFGRKRVHLCNLIHKLGKLRHYVCLDDISSCCNCFGAECILHILVPNSSIDWEEITSHVSKSRLGASILMTCRRIYDEANSILYESNTFDVNRKATSPIDESRTRSLEIILSPLFEFTDQVRPQFLDRITRLEMSWYFHSIPTMDQIQEEQVSSSAKTWSAHWDRIGRKFPNLRELVVRLIFDSLIEWKAGNYMYWALPMLNAVRGLRSCKIFVGGAGPRLKSLDDLAAVMCSRLSSPGDAAACVQKAMLEYPTCQRSPSFSDVYLGIWDGFVDGSTKLLFPTPEQS